MRARLRNTLTKILSGAALADEGKFFFDGEEVRIHNPGDARRLGIETIYQYFALVDNQPIYINLFWRKTCCPYEQCNRHSRK